MQRQRTISCGTIRTLVLLVFLVIAGARPAYAQAKADTPSEQEPLDQIVEKHFARWDKNNNGSLELDDVEHAMENRFAQGRVAALIFHVFSHMQHEHLPRISHQDLLTLVKSRGFKKRVENTTKDLEANNHQLFLPTDPSLSAFHQGGMGDCSLLAAVAAQVHRSPKAIREMIHPDDKHGFEVVFANGRKVKMAKLTDAELLMGASTDKHGIWLSVLEKAYGMIHNPSREKGREHKIVPLQSLDGLSIEAPITLLTGHATDSLDLDKKTNPEQVQKLLVSLSKKDRLMCTDTPDARNPPPGMADGHAYAILSYNNKRRTVSVFNPWGNQFTPKGNPGIANGYPTENGVFTVPLNEFLQIFSRVIYETDKVAAK